MQQSLLKTGGIRWEAALHWQTSGLSRAGWLVKDGSGTWSITDTGREALERFPDPVALKAESDQIYRAWYEASRAQRRRAWLIRGSSVRGTNLVAEWLESGWVSIAASQLHEIQPGISLEDLTAAAKSDYEALLR
jgi:restriction endonuclease Mrr